MIRRGRDNDVGPKEHPLPDGAALVETSRAGPAAIRGSGVRVVGYGCSVGLSIVGAAFLFRHLGVDDAGRYVTVIALVAVFGGITEAGLTTIGIREYAVKVGSDRDHFVRSLLGVRVVASVAGIALALAFAEVVGWSQSLVVGTLLVGLGYALQVTQTMIAVPLTVDLRYVWLTTIDFLRQVVAVGLTIALVLAGASLTPFFAVPLAASIVTVAVTVPLVHRALPLLPSFQPSRWWSVFRSALPFAAAVAVASVYFRIAVVLVSLIASPAETGYFGASFRVIEVLTVVPQLVIGTMFPIIAFSARHDSKRFSYAVSRAFQGSLILGTWVTLSLLLGANFAIQVVAGDEFAPAAAILRIQSLALLGSFVAAVWSYALLGLRGHRQLLVLSIAAFVVSSVLVAVLTFAFAAKGAAVGTIAGEALLAIGGTLLVLRQRSVDLGIGLVLRVAAAAAAAGLMAFATSLTEPVQVALATVVYGALLLMLRAVPRELLAEFGRLRPRTPAGP